MKLVRAELLKLRKRRGLVAAAAVLTIAPVAIGYTVLSILHATRSDEVRPGGRDRQLHRLDRADDADRRRRGDPHRRHGRAGDRGAGVFRELVVDGPPAPRALRRTVPGGLVFLLPFVTVAFAIAAVAAVTLTGDGQSPVAGRRSRRPPAGSASAWSSCTCWPSASRRRSARAGRRSGSCSAGSWPPRRSCSRAERLDDVLPNAALLALEPAEEAQLVTTSVPTAIAILVVWTLVPLAVGAWRTQTSDA